MSYEQGMIVQYIAATQLTHVSFRGDRVTLPEKHTTVEAGTRAGEDYCRNRGWKG